MIQSIAQLHRDYFNSGVTKQLPMRLAALKRLRTNLSEMEEELITALHQDFGKPSMEAYFTELVNVRLDLEHTIRNLRKWAKPEKIRPSLLTLAVRAEILREPLGVILVIVPFNYPVLLALSPIIAAVAAGNTVIVKTSSLTPNTSKVLDRLIKRTFQSGHVSLAAGENGINDVILDQQYDKIMFTGSSETGKKVMAKAAENLTPVLLELAGKNPVIVLRDANVAASARKIAWGAFLNAGQTCVSPDYVFVHEDIQMAFLRELERSIRQFYGEDPKSSASYGRIASRPKFDRLKSMLTKELDISAGGQTDAQELYIAPTVIRNVPQDHPLLQEEIFGPILPVQGYRDINAVIREIRALGKPLAAYVFGKNLDFAGKVLDRIPSGGGGINELILQLASPDLPFGGVGNSGMGMYHGKYGFDTFSHLKSVVVGQSNALQSLIYPPFDQRKERALKGLLRKFGRFL